MNRSAALPCAGDGQASDAAFSYRYLGKSMPYQSPAFTIRPASWLGPDVFYIGVDDERGVLLRFDGDAWRACSSVTQVFEGGIVIARKNVDMIEAAERAITLGLDPIFLKQLEERRLDAKMRAAK